MRSAPRSGRSRSSAHARGARARAQRGLYETRGDANVETKAYVERDKGYNGTAVWQSERTPGNG